MAEDISDIVFEICFGNDKNEVAETSKSRETETILYTLGYKVSKIPSGICINTIDYHAGKLIITKEGLKYILDTLEK